MFSAIKIIETSNKNYFHSGPKREIEVGSSLQSCDREPNHSQMCPYGGCFMQKDISMWIQMPEKVIKLQRVTEIKTYRPQHLEKGVKEPRGQEQRDV